MTMPNSVNRRPTCPSRNEIGMNTEISVIEVAMTANTT